MTKTFGREILYYILYLVLFCVSIFVNKYVLSVLNFIYPTIFQGWQTLIGGILLKTLLSNKCLPMTSTGLDRTGFISLLATFLFFSAGIVASSKALAGLNIAIFICLQNTLNSILYILDIATGSKGRGGGSRLLTLFFCLIALLSALGTIFFDIDLTISDSPYVWMLVYVCCLLVQNLHSKIVDERYGEIDRLYYCYIFSVIVLAPASLYLEEAFEVLKFPHVARYDFYGGCFLSGIAGVFLNLSIIKVRCQSYFNSVDALTRLLISSLSLLAFEDTTSFIVKVCVFVNIITASFVPLHNSYNSGMSSSSSLHSLISEDL